MDEFTTIAVFQDIVLANIVRGCLDSEGIDAWVRDEEAAWTNRGGVLGAQGVRVQVRTCDVEAATALLQDIEETAAAAREE